LAKLGPEPIGNAFNDNYLIKALRGRNTPIKSALLDQRIIAGLGNIYVCEALFRARISPKTLAGRVSKQRVSAKIQS
jgi:formamidopyrimidine-DNA glycosylase